MCFNCFLLLVVELMKYIDEILTLLQEAKVMVSSMDMADSVKVRYTIKQLARDLVLGKQLYNTNT